MKDEYVLNFGEARYIFHEGGSLDEQVFTDAAEKEVIMSGEEEPLTSVDTQEEQGQSVWIGHFKPVLRLQGEYRRQEVGCQRPPNRGCEFVRASSASLWG